MSKNLLLLFCLLACGIGIYVGCTKLNEYLDEEERWGAYCDLFPGKKGKPHSPNPERDSIYGYGIDLSHHNAEPEWGKLNIDFVILKATEGTDWIDPEYAIRLVKCKENYIPVGAYHFFIGKKDPRKEFENYQRIAGPFIDIIPIVDAERRPRGVSKKDYQNNLWSFMEHVHDAYGVYPIIYTGEDFYYSTIKEMLDKRYSHYAGIDIPEGGKNYPEYIWFGDVGKKYSKYSICPVIHQASIKQVPGTKSKVDFNELHIPLDKIKWKQKPENTL